MNILVYFNSQYTQDWHHHLRSTWAAPQRLGWSPWARPWGNTGGWGWFHQRQRWKTRERHEKHIETQRPFHTQHGLRMLKEQMRVLWFMLTQWQGSCLCQREVHSAAGICYSGNGQAVPSIRPWPVHCSISILWTYCIITYYNHH